VEFEPTSSRSAIVYPEGTPLDVVNGSPIALTPVAPEQPTTAAGLAPLIGAILFLLLLPFISFYLIKASHRLPAAQVEVLYRQMRRLLGWAGLSAGSWVTPDEFLFLHARRLEPYRRLDRALRQVTGLYRETLFSPHPPDRIRVRSATRLWRDALREWGMLWLRERWQRLRNL
jgi:hypothetical protein